jgi:hypothetical protein
MSAPSLRIAGLALLASLLATAPAAASPVDVPGTIGSVTLERVASRTPLAVLLPDTIDLDTDGTVYGSGRGARRSWSFALSGAPDCGGANACFLASFTAERGGTPDFRRRVTLRGGIPGWFKASSCGASCAPSFLQYRRRGVLYEISAKLAARTAAGQRRQLARAANAALRAGPRGEGSNPFAP